MNLHKYNTSYHIIYITELWLFNEYSLCMLQYLYEKNSMLWFSVIFGIMDTLLTSIIKSLSPKLQTRKYITFSNILPEFVHFEML
jgi:hypothetical protein